MNTEKVNRKEIAHYLGIHGASPDAQTEEVIEDCLRELSAKVNPKHVFRTYPLALVPPASEEEVPLLHFADIGVQSRDLSRNLAGCDEVLLFGATLGDGADFLIRRYEKTRMSRALVMQASAAAMIEAYCNEINDAWEAEYAAKGFSLKPRFSCGYGDFALEHQKDFLRVLELEKRLGIRLTDGCLMVPTKSVTAVIGIYQERDE
ncbi:MAG: Vitamin B12 dependent methionine synthase activation subunit [Lachnospiraceae bacterium]|nr:Vitamin B12 dependent methionine synthase activation subunit [Lachnospiraceae bacterium]